MRTKRIERCKMTPVRFTFDDEDAHGFEAWTDGSRWNGFLNIWVTPQVHAAVRVQIGDDDWYESGFHEIEQIDGHYSYAFGFTPMILEGDPASVLEHTHCPCGRRLKPLGTCEDLECKFGEPEISLNDSGKRPTPPWAITITDEDHRICERATRRGRADAYWSMRHGDTEDGHLMLAAERYKARARS